MSKMRFVTEDEYEDDCRVINSNFEVFANGHRRHNSRIKKHDMAIKLLTLWAVGMTCWVSNIDRKVAKFSSDMRRFDEAMEEWERRERMACRMNEDKL